MHDADGAIEFRADLATEKIGHGGVTIGSACGEICAVRFAPDAGELSRRMLYIALNGELPDPRVIGFVENPFAIGMPSGEVGVHVRLAGSEPDLADNHISEGDGLACSDDEFSGLSGLKGIELDHPSARCVGGGALRHPRESHGHRFTGVGPTPHGNGLIALQDHVVREKRGKADPVARSTHK